MALIDTYRSNMARKRDELAKLSADKARETHKVPALNNKIASAKRAISQTKSTSTAKSKMNEIDRAIKALADIDKKVAGIDKKIAAKEKAYAAEEKKYRQEEDRLNKKHEQDEKKRLQENEHQLRSINQSLQQQSAVQRQLSAEVDRLKYVPEKITVLFFATNPLDTDKLRLDQEVRSIQEMIRKSEHRDSILFESRWAVRPLDILQAINELNPDVIHFSGHGADTGELVLENTDGSSKFITKEAITQTITSASDKIHLMFFNACFSCEQAQAVVEHVDAAIGMTNSVSDTGACTFAAQFYSSLGFGLSLKRAFEQAKGTLMLESPAEQNTPKLYIKEGFEADDIYIVKPKEDAVYANQHTRIGP
ncbi:MAG: CHAT domain-containing protein [Oscillospiraceae bacterium]|nr:CHAT domain-containing protein [Oscillospiraceae bacterium]